MMELNRHDNSTLYYSTINIEISKKSILQSIRYGKPIELETANVDFEFGTCHET